MREKEEELNRQIQDYSDVYNSQGVSSMKGSRRINTVSERAKSAYGMKSQRNGNDTVKNAYNHDDFKSPNAGGLTEAKLNTMSTRERPATSSQVGSRRISRIGTRDARFNKLLQRGDEGSQAESMYDATNIPNSKYVSINDLMK
jgi:hypothetical protein